MAVPLTAYFQSRGVPHLEVTPGLLVPRHFGDATREHQAARGGAGLFDFSFMSLFEIRGPEAAAFLHRLQPRTITLRHAGRILYTMLCRDDATVFIDATVWVHGDGRYWLFTGRRADRAWVEAAAEGFDVTVQDRSGEFSVIALQGPASAHLLATIDPQAARALRYFRFAVSRLGSGELWIGRIGYTGERGYELLVDNAAAVALWQRLRDAGSGGDVAECGFEAANCLRIEAGYILFDRELRYAVTPEALGYARLQAAPGARPPPARLVGLRPARTRPGQSPPDTLALPEGPMPPVAKGRACLTSACRSPLYGTYLGMGYVCSDDRHPGTTVTLQDGRCATVARLPFYDPPRRVPRR